MIGTVIQHYRITAKLGEGGMGEVYRAEDVRLGRAVALKLMTLPEVSHVDAAETWERLVRDAAEPNAPAASACGESSGRSRAGDARLRFLREARTVSTLNHPGIVTIYDVGEWQGRLFIAMELVEGATLREKLNTGSLETKAVVKMAITLAEALGRAHQAGVIHRDIKPENIIISKEGQTKLLDFGIAKLRRPDARGSEVEEGAATIDPALTTPGFLLGTVHYMSPEQALQQEVDQRSDLFSMGVVLYECVAGRKAFDGPMVDAMFHISHDQPDPLRQFDPNVPEDLERIVEKLMEKDRDERYQNAGDLTIDLRRAERRMSAGTGVGASMMTGSVTGQVRGRAMQTTPAPAHLVPAATNASPRSAEAGYAEPLHAEPARSASPHWRLAALLGVAALAGALIAAALLRRSGSPGQTQVYPVTHLRRSITQPALSPDGKLITFISGEDQVYVALTSSGDATQLTHTPGPKSYPRFSGDGSRILYTRVDGQFELWEVPALGGDPHRVLAQAAFGAWSPEGSRLVFTRMAAKGANLALALYVSDARVNNPRKLADIEAAPNVFPAWTPDSRHIVYMEAYQRRRAPRLLAVSPEGDGPARTLVSENLISAPPAVSQDGKWVYYSATKENIVDLWRVPVAGGKPEQVTFSTGEDHSPALDPNGWLFYVSARHRSRLHLLKDSGSQLLADETLVADARLSPDGKTVAFVRPAWSGTVLGELMLLNVDNRRSQRLDTPGLASELHWSPDGKLLAYGSRASGRLQSFVLELQSGRSTPVPPAPDSETIFRGFSAQGRYVIERVRYDQSLGDVFVVDPASGKETPVAKDVTAFGWSNDGKWIGLAVVDAAQSTRLLLAPAEGGAPHEVFKGTAYAPWFHPSRPELLFFTQIAPPQLIALPIDADGRAGTATPYVSPVLMQAITEFGPEAVKHIDAGNDRVLVRVNESDMDIVKRKVVP